MFFLLILFISYYKAENVEKLWSAIISELGIKAKKQHININYE